MVARLAFLGAVKHYKRSLVVVAAVAVACTVMISVSSHLNGVTASFYDSVIPNSGHVRIDDAKSTYALNPLGLATLIPEAEEMIDRIKSLEDPRIVDVEPLLSFGGLLVEYIGEGDPRNLAMRGIALRQDSRFADNVRYAIIAGGFLPGGSGIAISQSAARLVGAELGKGVLVLVQDRAGQPWYEKLTVTGIFKTESRDFDETTFYIDEGKAAEMLDVAGSAREIRLLLANRDDAAGVVAKVGAVLGREPGGSVRIQTWQTVNASFFSILLFVSIILGVIMALFAIVAGTIIANVSMMSVMERLREFGTMRAMGLRTRALERLILIEGAMLGAAGAALGVVLGSVVVFLLSRGGLDLGGIMENLGVNRYTRPRPSLILYGVCALAGFFVSLAATARAARTVRSMSVADSLSTAS